MILKHVIAVLKKHKNLSSVSVLFILSFVLATLWFPKNKIWGGADVGIPFYNLQQQLKTVSSAWWETHATGITSPVPYTSVPFYAYFSMLEKLGVTPAEMQKLFTFLILFSGGLSIYFIFLHFFPDRKNFALAASLFSLANPVSLTVWHRGVHNGMLMLAFIPVSLFLLIKGISNKSYFSIIYLNLSSLVFSYVYGAPGYVFTTWLVWGSYLVYTFFTEKNERKFIFTYSIFLFLSWLLSNSWWLFPFIKSSQYVLEAMDSGILQSRTIDVLIGLKEQTNISYILRGVSWFDLYNRKDWGEIYTHPLFIFISWISAIVIFSTSLFKDVRNTKIWRYLFIFTLILIFISKGVNPPFGFINEKVYEGFTFLAPLRNPHEKVGIALFYTYALLFGIGLFRLTRFVQADTRVKGKIIAFSVLAAAFIFVWPIWIGKIFQVSDYNYLIDIPNYYKEADVWLQERNDDTRILHLPLAPGESVDYDWGFTGGVPSQVLFRGSSIAYATGIQSVDTRLKDLIYSLHNKDTENVKKSLKSLNIGWIVVHNETEWRRRELESLDRVNDWLESNSSFLQHQKDFDPLSIWKVTQESRGEHIYSPEPPFFLISGKPINLNSFWKKQETTNSMFMFSSPEDPTVEKRLENLIGLELIYPTKVVKYSRLKTEDTSTLPYVNKLPDSPLYPLIKTKEFIENSYSSKPPTIRCINSASKRLSEAIALKQINPDKAKPSLVKYKEVLKECSLLITTTTLKGSINKLSLLLYDNLSGLDKEFSFLEGDPVFDEANNLLKKIMYDLEIFPYFGQINLDEKTKAISYTYQVAKNGMYSLEIDELGSDLFFYPTLVKINDSEYNLEPEVDEDKLIFSPLSLSAGKNEIHLKFINKNTFSLMDIKLDNSTVLRDEKDEDYIIELISDKDKIGKFYYDLGKVKDVFSYDIVLDYFVIKGATPVLKVNQDSDYIHKTTGIDYKLKGLLFLSNYDRFWLREGYQYEPSINANNATVIFEISLWNNCEDLYSESSCVNEEFSKIFNRSSQVWIKNIEIIANYKGLPTLNLIEDKSHGDWGDVVFKYNKINSGTYKLDIKNQSPPYVLVFSETYHPLWKLYNDKKEEIKDAKHFQANGYANAWLVEEEIPDEVIIRFSLEDYKKRGIIITIVGVIVLVPVLIFLQRKRKHEYQKTN